MEIPKDCIGSAPGQRCWVTSTFYGKTNEEVELKVNEYFKAYDPRGYSTRSVSKPILNGNGYWCAEVERYSTAH